MLLSRDRLFERRPPSREAKIIYIFCEGADTELRYFQYFQEMDSRIHLEIYKLHPHEDNSPLGLLQIADDALIVSAGNPSPKFALQEGDEVWIVLDSDPDRDGSRKPQITIVKAEVKERKGWFVVESNPCFEVWLYYHGREEVDEFEDKEKCKSWKGVVNSVLAGGFDPRKHPIFIQDAKRRAEANFELGEDGHPKIGSTEVFRLADSILRLLGDEIREERVKLP